MTPEHLGPRGVRQSAAIRDGLFDGLLWPALLRAAPLALRPARLGLALVAVVAIALVFQIPNLWLGRENNPAATLARSASDAADGVGTGLMRADAVDVGQNVYGLVWAGPASAFRLYPWSTFAVIIPCLLIGGILGGAIARSAADEFSREARVSWTSSLAFGLRRWASFLGVNAGVPLVAGLLVILLAAVGWVAFRFPGVQVAGGLVYFLALLVGLVVVLLLAGALLGCQMLIPALACEGSDAIDAIQRVLAYVYARPLRVVLYMSILLAELVLATVVIAAVIEACSALTTWATTAWLPTGAAIALRSAAAPDAAPLEAGWSLEATARLVSFWSTLLRLFAAAFVVSFWFCGGTILYLLLRRLCDGQDPGELWVPPTGSSAPHADALTYRDEE